MHCPNINLIGVSTVCSQSIILLNQKSLLTRTPKTHGNAPSTHTALNAARCLHAYGAAAHIKVFPGATKPLILPAKHDPEIHGEDGLGGVEGLPDAKHPAISERFVKEEHGDGVVRALEGMVQAIRRVWNHGRGEKVTIVSTGPMTNVALFVSVYPELIERGAVEELVFMGGGVGLGNRSAVAEYNILTDRESPSSFIVGRWVPDTL